MTRIRPTNKYRIYKNTFHRRKKETPITVYGSSMSLNINLFKEPSTLDPRFCSDMFRSCFSHWLFSALTKAEPNGQINMASAKSVHISDDLKSYTFTLRDLKWSDGSQLTAYDFERSFKTLLHPNFPCIFAYLLFSIKNAKDYKLYGKSEEDLGVNALDDKTLFFELEKPCYNFLEILSSNMTFPMPPNMLDTDYPTTSNDKQVLINNGPFCLKHWERGEEIILEKNPQYWNSKKSKLKKLKVSFITDIDEAFKMYENNQFDYIGTFLSPIPLKKQKKYANKIEMLPYIGRYIVHFNCTSSPFNNENLRKAFHHAIPRESIATSIEQDEYKPAYAPVGFNDSLNKSSSIQKEKALYYFRLASEELQSTIKNQAIEFIHLDCPIHKKIASHVTNEIKNLFNIDVSAKALDFNQFFSRRPSKKFQMALHYSIPYLFDSTDLFERYKYKDNLINYSGWESSEYIDLLDKAELVEKKDDRKKILSEAEKILVEECPVSVILQLEFSYLQKPYIKGVTYGPSGIIQFDQVSF